MTTNKTLGVFIPARLSSERLPNKLILPFGESCLFDIACQKLNSLPEHIGKYALVYDEELIDIAKKYENIKIIIRSEASAKAETPLSFIFEDMKQATETHLLFLNPCLAFLTKETIEAKAEEFLNSNADYGTSVKGFQNWLFDENGNSLNEIDYKELTTKKIKPVYQTAHCFHVFNKDLFFEDNMMLKEGLMPLEIPYKETIDVDTLEEYEFARWKYEKDLRNRH